jgi:hypothetical protein
MQQDGWPWACGQPIGARRAIVDAFTARGSATRHAAHVGGSDVDAVAEVIARERALLRPEVRSSADLVDQLLDPDFSEIGASGRLWTRAETIEALAEGRDGPPSGPIGDTEMQGRRLADDLVLLTYVSDSSGRRARRTSLWRRSGRQWRLVHHQGTLLP